MEPQNGGLEDEFPRQKVKGVICRFHVCLVGELSFRIRSKLKGVSRKIVETTS